MTWIRTLERDALIRFDAVTSFDITEIPDTEYLQISAYIMTGAGSMLKSALCKYPKIDKEKLMLALEIVLRDMAQDWHPHITDFEGSINRILTAPLAPLC